MRKEEVRNKRENNPSNVNILFIGHSPLLMVYLYEQRIATTS
jgi:hypothetical protein